MWFWKSSLCDRLCIFISSFYNASHWKWWAEVFRSSLELCWTFSTAKSRKPAETSDPTQPPICFLHPSLPISLYHTVSSRHGVSTPPPTLNIHLLLQVRVRLLALHHTSFFIMNIIKKIQRLKLSVSSSEGLQKFKTQCLTTNRPANHDGPHVIWQQLIRNQKMLDDVGHFTADCYYGINENFQQTLCSTPRLRLLLALGGFLMREGFQPAASSEDAGDITAVLLTGPC